MQSRLSAVVRIAPVLFLVIAAAGSQAACRSKEAAPPPTTTVSADTWAVVDGRAITRNEVDKAFRRVRDVPPTVPQEETLAGKLTLLDELIVQDLLLAKAGELKIDVPASELDTAFNNARKNIPDEDFQKELTRRNLTAEDMREGLRRDLLAQKVLEREVASKVTVTEQEVTDFFNANRAQFNLTEEAYRVGQIVITPVPEPQATNRTGDDATTPEAAAAKVKMLMERLQAGTAFRDLALDYSEEAESAARGGDLGLLPVSRLKQAPAALRDAVLGAKPGSARVVSQGGAHTIVVVVAHEAAGQRDLSTPGLRDQITQTLRARREQLLRAAYLTSLRSNADVTNYLARRLVETQGKATP
jgi:peptidyl-prolyl cis-trans isomerase SurA